MLRTFASTVLASSLALTGCGAAAEGPIGDDANENTVASSPDELLAPSAWKPTTCNAAGTRCIATGLPVFAQGDDVLKQYAWTVFPGEPYANSAAKGAAVSMWGCYDTSIAMVQVAALAGRSTKALSSSSRTYGWLTEPLVQPVNGGRSLKTFTRQQVNLLFTAKSNYDGGGKAANYSTRGNAYHFPEMLADLGTITKRIPADCDPYLYGACTMLEGSAGTFRRENVGTANASDFSNWLFIEHVSSGFLPIIAFIRPGGTPHKVVVAGWDSTNPYFPLVIHDPATGTARAATYRVLAGSKPTLLFSDEATVENRVEMTERVRMLRPLAF